MIIGVSGGDIYLGIKLLKDSLQALSSTKGSQKQYVDAVRQLETLEVCLRVAQSRLGGLEADDSRGIIARAITECAKCVDSYQTEILSKYEKFFGDQLESNARRKFLKELKKIQWLHEKEKTQALSKAISSHIQIITLACSIGSLPRSGNSRRRSITSPTQLATVLELEDTSCPLTMVTNVSSSDFREEVDGLSVALGPDQKKKTPESSRSFSNVAASVARILESQPINSSAEQSPLPSSAVASMQSDCGREQYYPEGLWRSGRSTLSPKSPASTPCTASIFSNDTSVTSASIATTVQSWVDDRGICRNPRCQQRSFIQKKAFKLYTHLTHSSVTSLQSESSGGGGHQPKPACEHALLYLQAMSSSASVALGTQR